MAEKIKTVVITGPTATGKTALAVKLARIFPAEIVSVDSRQVYRGMDIGTGKDLDEYGEVPYHLIDIADPQREVYNLARFVRDAYRAVWEIAARGRIPILCGGTALYLAALLDGYRLPGGALPPRGQGIERVRQNPENERSFEPPFELDALILGVYYPRSEVHARIEARLDSRLTDGLVDEVQKLHEINGVSWEQLEFFGLEYREAARYLKGECTLVGMRNTLLCRIRQFAKRQDIFFRKLEREGHRIHWLKAGGEPDPCALVEAFLNGEPLPEPAFRLCDINYGRK
ncbi:MAG: tRNA dimethylallyltransferase [Lentisphaeria bacterium]|nr:tRNA dimethylallyltransferase [Lentisphaeria bacterium]